MPVILFGAAVLIGLLARSSTPRRPKPLRGERLPVPRTRCGATLH